MRGAGVDSIGASICTSGYVRKARRWEAQMSVKETVVDLSKEPAFEIGALKVRPSVREIEYGRKTQQIQPRIMQVLIVLARTRGEVVSRDDLIRLCWGLDSLSDDALNRVTSKLRQLLREIGSDAQIETIPRVGYRLTAPTVSNALSSRKTPWAILEQALSRGPMRKFGAPIALAVLAGVIVLSAIQLSSGDGAEAASGNTARYNSIAVLPFDDLSKDGDLAYLAAGAAEEFRNALANGSERLRVSARASSNSAPVDDMTLEEIADVLNVDLLLEGAIADINQRTRLSLSLVDPETGLSIWDRAFDFSADNLDEIRPIVVSDVFEAINLRPADQPTPTAEPVISSAASENFLKANYFLSRGDTASLERARDLYLAVIESEPLYAPGYAQLVAVSLAAAHEWRHTQARAYLDRAIELDPWSRETLLAEQLFNDHMRFDGMTEEWLSRPNEPRRDAVLDDNARLRTLVVQSRYRDAETLANEIIERDPIGAETNAFLARILSRRGKPQQALDRLDQALVYNPGSLDLRFWRINALAEMGDYLGSYRELVNVFEIAPDDLRTRYFLTVVTAEVGLRDEALAISGSPMLRLRALHDAGEMGAVAALVSAEMVKAPSTEARVRMYLLRHDLQAALPWLQRMHDRGMQSNYVEHPSDYKPYLALALRQSGDEDAAASLDREILAEIEQQASRGDESVVLFHPFKIFAAAARNDKATLYQLLDEAAAGGYILFGLDDVIFDHLRDDPDFALRYAAFRQIRETQRERIVESGLIDRVRAVLASSSAPPR